MRSIRILCSVLRLYLSDTAESQTTLGLAPISRISANSSSPLNLSASVDVIGFKSHTISLIGEQKSSLTIVYNARCVAASPKSFFFFAFKSKLSF